MKSIFKLLLLLPVAAVCSCAGFAASANEYFTIGMSYFELGKYEDAEFWLNRAKAADKTMTASQYNLGRIAFERKRYFEAVGYFEDILKIDPDNVHALRAAAYTRIKTGDIYIAEGHYNRLLYLIPENADDGYNHALVLYAMERYLTAELLLEKYELQMLENDDMQLLYARCQKAQNKVEAIDSYASLLNNKKDAKIRNEYAQLLESHELYARALEEYHTAITETEDADSKKYEIRFNLARLLLIADSTSDEGIIELQNAVNDGFRDITAIEELLKNDKIIESNKDSIRNIIKNSSYARQ
jgi:tetratricopeptide (TPR) repeat protein